MVLIINITNFFIIAFFCLKNLSGKYPVVTTFNSVAIPCLSQSCCICFHKICKLWHDIQSLSFSDFFHSISYDIFKNFLWLSFFYCKSTDLSNRIAPPAYKYWILMLLKNHFFTPHLFFFWLLHYFSSLYWNYLSISSWKKLINLQILLIYVLPLQQWNI